MKKLIFLVLLFAARYSFAGLHICQTEDSVLLLSTTADHLTLEDFEDPGLETILTDAGLRPPLRLTPNGTTVFSSNDSLRIRTDLLETGVRLRVGVGVGPMKLDLTWNCGAPKPSAPKAKTGKPSAQGPLGDLGAIKGL